MLELWLNATFAHALDIEIPPRTEVCIEGTQLALLPPNDNKLVSRPAFEMYFYIFYKCNTFDSSMVAFPTRWCGPTLFHTSSQTLLLKRRRLSITLFSSVFVLHLCGRGLLPRKLG